MYLRLAAIFHTILAAVQAPCVLLAIGRPIGMSLHFFMWLILWRFLAASELRIDS